MKLIHTKLEGKVWRKVCAAQQAGKPLPVFKGHDAEALARLMSRFPEWEATQKRERLEAWMRRRLSTARKWAYHNLLGFHRHQGMFHPDLVPWAEEHGTLATDAEWIAAATEAHAKRPVPILGHDTEPVTPEHRGQVPRKTTAP